MTIIGNKVISTQKRLTNHDLIRYQKRVHALFEQMNKIQDEYEQALEIMEAELEYMPPAMCRLDENGMFIPADISDEFIRQQGLEIPKREED